MIYIIKERTKVLDTCSKKRFFDEKCRKRVDFLEVKFLTKGVGIYRNDMKTG